MIRMMEELAIWLAQKCPTKASRMEVEVIVRVNKPAHHLGVLLGRDLAARRYVAESLCVTEGSMFSIPFKIEGTEELKP